nr:MAG TPA: hypothetical protein [Caudoviricetes sp.]
MFFLNFFKKSDLVDLILFGDNIITQKERKFK